MKIHLDATHIVIVPNDFSVRYVDVGEMPDIIAFYDLSSKTVSANISCKGDARQIRFLF